MFTIGLRALKILRNMKVLYKATSNMNIMRSLQAMMNGPSIAYIIIFTIETMIYDTSKKFCSSVKYPKPFMYTYLNS
jgi:hypothetical protein